MESAVDSVEETTQEDGEWRQEIWSWGAGTDGQLATGRLEDEHSPQLIRSLSACGPITSLACGGAHVIALLPGGRVLTWGRGNSGQLGHGEMVNCLQPRAVEALDGIVATSVSAGWNHSGFVSDNGTLFTCGDGSYGQLGRGDCKSQCSPLQVSYLSAKHVDQVACGMRHSLVLTRDNEVYGFGSGKRGQLGISTEKVKSISYPQITMKLTDLRVVKIRANGDHSAALFADGSLCTWGRGYGGASDACMPCHFDAAVLLEDIALGWNHALLLTRGGEVFMLGGNRHGLLSDPQKISVMSDGASGKSKEGMMQAISDLMDIKVLQIAAGAEHSAVVTDDGYVMMWGWGEHGQLGLGNSDDQTAPQVVSLDHPKFTEKHSVSKVYCGSGFSYVVRTVWIPKLDK